MLNPSLIFIAGLESNRHNSTRQSQKPLYSGMNEEKPLFMDGETLTQTRFRVDPPLIVAEGESNDLNGRIGTARN